MAFSPILGRWVQADPAGYVDGSNLYGFVGGNPTGFVDPAGTDGKPTTKPMPKPPTQPTSRPTTRGSGDWSDLPEEPDIAAPKYPPQDAKRKEREQFAQDLMMFYQQWAARAGDRCCLPDACTLAAQWMQESDWGREKVNQETHNLGNIKGQGPAGSVNAKQDEVINGKRIKVNDPLRKYHNLEEFFDDYNKLVCKSERYKNARGKTGRAYFQALKDAGYATDPNYVEGVMKIYRQLGC